MDNFRVVRVAQNGGNFVPFQAHDLFEIRGAVVGEAHANALPIVQHAHQRTLLKASFNAKHTARQQAAALVQQGPGRARIDMYAARRVRLIGQPELAARYGVLRRANPCTAGERRMPFRSITDTAGREGPRNHVRFPARQDQCGHANLRGTAGRQQFGIHAARTDRSFAAAQLPQIKGGHIIYVVKYGRMRIFLRVGSQHTRGGSEIYEQIRPGEVHQKACQTVIIAEFQLADGNGVVFVHNGQNAPFQQLGKGIARIEKTLPGPQILAGKQHLGRGHAVGKKNFVPGLHELALPHGGCGLTGR